MNNDGVKDRASEQRVEELLQSLSLRDKVALLSGQDSWRTVAIEKAGVPSIVMTDGPHGVRATRMQGRVTGPATAFPTGVSFASTWNPELIRRVGVALGEETRAMGCHVLLGPCVNIMRTPLAGRNFEAYAEDPFLAGRIGVAWVNGVQSVGVATSLKHFACNNQEFERFRSNSVVDERTLREIYLAQFETIVKEANPWTVMCSYNRLNGEHASQNWYLLTGILKNEWGWDGAVVSDWGANHTTIDSVEAGLDIEMPGPAKYYGPLLVEAVHFWQLDEAVVDEAARRMLRLIARCGELDNSAELPAGSVNTEEHQALARQVAEEAITLLKNDDGVLPIDLAKVKSIAVIGPNAAQARLGGGGSAYVDAPYTVSPLDGLRALLGDTVQIRYEQGCDNVVEPPTLPSEYLAPAGGEGHGLRAEYFARPDLSGEPDLVRTDEAIDFRMAHGDPAPGVSKDRFAVRWSGTLRAPASGAYTLTLFHTGVARLYLDGALLIDHQSPEQLHLDPAQVTASAQVDLEQGRAHDLRVEFVKQTDERYYIARLSMARFYRPGEDDRIERAVQAAREADVALVFAGLPERYETEGRDRPNWDLTGPQHELIRSVVAANPQTVVVVNAGAPVNMPWAAEVPALVWAHYPGMEGGNALARILTGQVNPSGKLTFTMPKRYEDNPTYINYPGGRDLRYGEGIYVGYRYYDTAGVEPLFPFGHGLSYTSFDYSDLQAPAQVAQGEDASVSLTVTNSGAVAGQEVVQLYVRDVQSSLPRPPKELKGFAKVALAPGEAKTVTFTLDQRSFAFYDPQAKAWIAEAGEYEVMVGASSRDIRVVGRLTLE